MPSTLRITTNPLITYESVIFPPKSLVTLTCSISNNPFALGIAIMQALAIRLLKKSS